MRFFIPLILFCGCSSESPRSNTLDVLAVMDADADTNATLDAIVDMPRDDIGADLPGRNAVDATSVEDTARDVTTDRAEAIAVDVPPARPNLDAPRTSVEVRTLYTAIEPRCSSDCRNVIETTDPRATCAVNARAGTLTFTAYGCVGSLCSQILASLPLASGTARSVTVVGPSGQAGSGLRVEVEAGTAYTADVRRQGFRVGFAVPETTPIGGVTGVPGRTIAPDLGDVWLLGCPVSGP